MSEPINKVYLVVEGRHEYNALAVFTKPELAEQYIAAHMTTTFGSDDRDEYDVMEFSLNEDAIVRQVFRAEMQFATDNAPNLCADEKKICPETFEECNVFYGYYHSCQVRHGPSCRADALSADRALELVTEAYAEWVESGRPMTNGQGNPD